MSGHFPARTETSWWRYKRNIDLVWTIAIIAERGIAIMTENAEIYWLALLKYPSPVSIFTLELVALLIASTVNMVNRQKFRPRLSTTRTYFSELPKECKAPPSPQCYSSSTSTAVYYAPLLRAHGPVTLTFVSVMALSAGIISLALIGFSSTSELRKGQASMALYTALHCHITAWTKKWLEEVGTPRCSHGSPMEVIE